MEEKQRRRIPSMIQVGEVIVSMDCLTEAFCCDLSKCHGACCVEGEAGAPLKQDEVGKLEQALDEVWPRLGASAQAVIDKQGVAYTDADGDLVTSIVEGKDCVFTCHQDGCCFCALEQAYREKRTNWCKPISCALYPVREASLGNGLSALNYHRWGLCKDAVRNGRKLGIPLYRFLRDALERRFGKAWYAELEAVASALHEQGYI